MPAHEQEPRIVDCDLQEASLFAACTDVIPDGSLEAALRDLPPAEVRDVLAIGVDAISGLRIAYGEEVFSVRAMMIFGWYLIEHHRKLIATNAADGTQDETGAC